MSKHTEGPWILSEYEVRHPITLELRKGCEIFCKDNNRVVCEIPDYHFHAEDVEYQSADARLITSAPDLLEALEAFERIKDIWLPAEAQEQHAEEMYALHMARNNMLSAIAKARGEA